MCDPSANAIRDTEGQTLCELVVKDEIHVLESIPYLPIGCASVKSLEW
jgi:hypothetical protein